MNTNGNVAARRKVLLASGIGTIIEWYDSGLYGFLAITIAAQFFPKEDPNAALLSTFAIFAVGFVPRPVGAVAFGYLGDRLGRRPALVLSVMLMSAATVAIGLLPGYAQIGIAAPALLLVCRLVQGFSAGGEYTGAAVFILEHAPQQRRGRYVSVAPLTSVLGYAFGAVVAVAVASATTDEQLAAWGWRVPFLAAAPLALVGLYLRLRVEESPEFTAMKTERQHESAPIVQVLKTAKKSLLIAVGYTMTNSVAFYLLSTFLTAYLTRTAGFSTTKALVVQVVIMFVLAAAIIVAGRLIDVVGRKRIAVTSALCLGAWAVPAFALLGKSSLLEACLIAVVFAVLFSGISASTALAVVELFPAQVRASASGLAYTLAYTLFGGTAPYVATWLLGRGLPLAPGYYLAILCAVSTVVAAIGIGNSTRSAPAALDAARRATATPDPAAP